MQDNTSRPQWGIGTVVNHARFGGGRILGYDGDRYVVAFKGGDIQRYEFTDLALREVARRGDPDYDRVLQAVREVLGDAGWVAAETELGQRWAGGTLRLIPGKEGLQPKDVPIETFFKKLIGTRDKLRVLEQKLNAHPHLSPEDKLDLQGYVTRCYGSLTTFNILFAEKESQFTGQKDAEKE